MSPSKDFVKKLGFKGSYLRCNCKVNRKRYKLSTFTLLTIRIDYLDKWKSDYRFISKVSHKIKANIEHLDVRSY